MLLRQRPERRIKSSRSKQTALPESREGSSRSLSPSIFIRTHENYRTSDDPKCVLVQALSIGGTWPSGPRCTPDISSRLITAQILSGLPYEEHVLTFSRQGGNY
ncbi:hypothetical protein AVEN_210753-1 [Araneus ventricosus]|uniref:Uncharacterized protein n=1 Tax=Araneus ventricosus TaxID=182803 RepID=A0A4Y2U5B0_ARAVE|nr:hypothetical protein AVEN_210753-1 [Araneus ventricosus]